MMTMTIWWSKATRLLEFSRSCPHGEPENVKRDETWHILRDGRTKFLWRKNWVYSSSWMWFIININIIQRSRYPHCIEVIRITRIWNRSALYFFIKTHQWQKSENSYLPTICFCTALYFPLKLEARVWNKTR